MNEHEPRDLAGGFAPLFKRLRELQRRFRPGAPFEWPEHSYTRRPLAARKAARRRKNKAAKFARRHNRRSK